MQISAVAGVSDRALMVAGFVAAVVGIGAILFIGTCIMLRVGRVICVVCGALFVLGLVVGAFEFIFSESHRPAMKVAIMTILAGVIGSAFSPKPDAERHRRSTQSSRRNVPTM